MSDMFALSTGATKLLRGKAKEFGLSVDETLEYMVMEFSPSTAEDRLRWAHEKKKSRDTFLAGSQCLVCVWNDGYKAGWNHFQTRKENHPYKRVE